MNLKHDAAESDEKCANAATNPSTELTSPVEEKGGESFADKDADTLNPTAVGWHNLFLFLCGIALGCWLGCIVWAITHR